MTLSCLCGRTRIKFEERPEFMHECNCAFCRKSGARWSYLHPAAVVVDGETRAFLRADKDTPAAETHFCGECGATTHFVLTEAIIAEHGNSMMGVNMNLAKVQDLKGIELRFPDGATWDGTGEFGYVREAITL